MPCSWEDHQKVPTWVEYDARGIPLARVCSKCKKEVLSKYRPEVLTDPQYECDEPIEPDPEVGSW